MFLANRPVVTEFHARFSAIARTYHYILYVHPVRPALFAEAVGWYHHSVRVDLMQQAADLLLGTHDFTCFRASECQAKTPIRTVSRAHLRAIDPYIIVELRADAFLHHMVRNILGSLVYVGKGKFPPEWFAELLKARNRDRAAPTFSPRSPSWTSACR